MTIIRFALLILPAAVVFAPPLAVGARAGAFAALMKDVVAKLDEEDMLAIAAYLAAQTP